MAWFTSPQLNRRQDRSEVRIRALEDMVEDLRKDLAEASRNVRTLDMDIVGLEDKVKAFTGRLSVRKRKDRKEPEVEVEPQDLNALIRDGKLTTWP